MALTGTQLRQGISKFMSDYEASSTSSAGNAGGTTLIDSYLGKYGDDRIVGWWVLITSGDNDGEVRAVTANTDSTGTVTVQPAFSAQVASGVSYELHKYEPNKKYDALDAARIEASDTVFRIVYDDSLTSDGRTATYDIPSTVRGGPPYVLVERPLEADSSWNFLQDPRGNSTDNWTAASATATVVNRAENDLLIPKYDESCTKIAVATATNGTYTQPVGSMINSISASLAAGRVMTFAAWVYCLTASRVSLEVTDDTDTSSSSTHGGAGWELLSVEKNIETTNSTTLTVGFDVSNASGAVTLWYNRAWFYFGDKERATEVFPQRGAITVRRDATEQQVTLSSVPPRGRQIRLIGKDVLTELSRTVTNSMEVDQELAEVLYSHATRILFGWEGLEVENFEPVLRRIQLTEQRTPKLVNNWHVSLPTGARVTTPYSH